MSKISLKHSGGNVVSLNSPTSAPTSADVAFKLPNADGTSGQAMVTDASGNLSFAATGKILQVVSTTKTDTFSSSTINSFVDITGLSVTITPTGSNKVIVFMTVHMGIDNDGYNGFMRGIRTTSGSVTNLSYPSSTGSSNRASNAGVWTDSTSVPDNHTHAMHIVGFEDSPGAGTHQYGIQIGSSYTRTLNTGEPYDGEATGHVYAPSGTITLYEVEA